MHLLEKMMTEIDKLVSENDKILLAVSGGIDSMVMMDFFRKQFPKDRLAVAHCNFSLRGDDSIKDMELVEQMAFKNELHFHKIIFDTETEMHLRRKGLQETARELRYEWFEQLTKEYCYAKIATAHNTNDNIETFFVNCVRGTGIRGLAGIPVVNNKIIRPFINITRDDIVKYASRNRLSYREDKSNASTKYLRNSIRHRIIPEMIERNEHFISMMNDNIFRVKESVEFIDFMIDAFASKYVVTDENIDKIDISKINPKYVSYILYEIMRKYGFAKVVTNSILINISASSGNTFQSKTHIAYINRGFIEIKKNDLDIYEGAFSFSKDANAVELESGILHFKLVDNIDIDLKCEPNIAMLDYDKLGAKLTVRQWHYGDYFYPFGMSNKKALSDFFIDKKISVSQKKQIPVLCNDSDIVWILGLRSDNRYRVTNETVKVLICCYEK